MRPPITFGFRQHRIDRSISFSQGLEQEHITIPISKPDRRTTPQAHPADASGRAVASEARTKIGSQRARCPAVADRLRMPE
jgi:hypothetical protein